MKDTFKEALKAGYRKDPTYQGILRAMTEDHMLFHFHWDNNDDLLYFIGPDKAPRLCIPESLLKTVFKSHHNKYGYIGFHKLYHLIASQFYIKGLTRRLKEYLRYCPKCLTHQTKWHKLLVSCDQLLF
jgi:hypothetical protein